MSFLRAVALVMLMTLTFGCGGRTPVIDRVWAAPDTVPRGGVSFLRVRTRGTVEARWEPTHGTVNPATGDSTLYLAPSEEVDDTVRVFVTDERGRREEGLAVVHVREGLCGGRPEALVSTTARLLVADESRVYYVEPAGTFSQVRRVSVNGVERDTVATRPHEIRRFIDGGTGLYWLERDVSGDEPKWRVMAASKGDTARPVQFLEFTGRSASIYDIAVTAGDLHVAWLETVADTGYVTRITSYPRAGGAGRERFALAGPVGEGTFVSRMAVDGGDLYFLLVSNDPAKVAVMKLPVTGPAQTLVGPGFLAPGTLAADDGLAVADGQVFWSERIAGRIGRVRADGTGPEFIVPAGGDARDVELLGVAAGPGGAAPRLFWTVPGDLRAMIVGTGVTLLDIDRWNNRIFGFTDNGLWLFYVREEGSSDGRMFRLLIP
ncbi:MAG TPA: hypothetical protein ENN51_06650 [candidate division WOR-3 bacterium]|uniref:Uncharacterized protein n=1 Tax=candidate division WOR-3 bacterium TaxID=2052148 RepID=A0A7V0T685_UNCW3|nr:hypothetical protein [candidate division WOR-3 bacterium]